MKAAAFAYRRPADLPEALELLSAGNARVLAGGQSFLPMLNMRLVRPELVVDIGGLPELRGLRAAGDGIVAGALVTYRELGASVLVRERCPLLAHVTRYVGDPQVRNRGTIGGSLAQGEPTAEIPLACLVLGATAVAASTRGTRTIAVGDLLAGPYETVLEPEELITEVHVPPSQDRFAFAEATRRHNDFAIVSAAAVGTVAGDGSFTDLTLGFGGVADTVILAPETARILTGRRPEPGLVDQAVAACRAEIDPGDDIRSSAAYRRHLAGEYLRRVIGGLGMPAGAAG
jgi:aerobic carbon-monoxide dehydrogenase medium subunit